MAVCTPVAFPPPSAGTWTTVGAFTNGYSAGSVAPGYRRTAEGQVYMRGFVAPGTSGAVAFTLPAGFRPGQTAQFACSNSGPSAQAAVLGSSGTVTLYPNGMSSMWLDNISFLAEN